MKRLKEIKKFIDDLSDCFNLNKHFPNYFNKNVFRVMIVCMILIALYGWHLQGFAMSNIYVKCNDAQCQNPLYICKDYYDWMNGCISSIAEIPPDIRQICYEKEKLCDRKILYRGEVIGKPVNSILRNFGYIVLCLIIIAFAVNHYLFVLRFRKKVKEMINK